MRPLLIHMENLPILFFSQSYALFVFLAFFILAGNANPKSISAELPVFVPQLLDVQKESDSISSGSMILSKHA